MTDVATTAELEALREAAGIPHLPTQLTFEARLAISGEGPRAYDWSDKPHRIVYDLCREIEDNAVERDRLREVVLEADKLLCGDLAGLQWKRDCRSFLVWARAVLRGESHE